MSPTRKIRMTVRNLYRHEDDEDDAKYTEDSLAECSRRLHGVWSQGFLCC